MKRVLIRTALGTVIGAALGTIPGIVSSLPVAVVGLGYGYGPLVTYMGLLVGAAAGSLIGTILAAVDVLQGSPKGSSR